jgi:hypothetical protein
MGWGVHEVLLADLSVADAFCRTSPLTCGCDVIWQIACRYDLELGRNSTLFARQRRYPRQTRSQTLATSLYAFARLTGSSHFRQLSLSLSQAVRSYPGQRAMGPSGKTV